MSSLIFHQSESKLDFSISSSGNSHRFSFKGEFIVNTNSTRDNIIIFLDYNDEGYGTLTIDRNKNILIIENDQQSHCYDSFLLNTSIFQLDEKLIESFISFLKEKKIKLPE